MFKNVIAISLFTMMASTVHAQTITFDDIQTSRFTSVVSPYAGLTWNNFDAVNTSNAVYIGTGYENSNISGDNAAFNEGGTTASISSTTAFSMQSAYFTDAWENSTLTVTGYNNGTSVWSQSFDLNTSTPILALFNSAPVTSVTFSNQGTWFAMDNLTVGAVAAVPEPETYALMGVGLLGLLAARRKKVVNTMKHKLITA